MEALTAVSVACLTVYDMTKALSHDIVIDVFICSKLVVNQITVILGMQYNLS